MVAKMNGKAYIYLFWLHLLLKVLFTVFDRFLFVDGHNRYMSVAIVLEMNLFYPLMGYYVECVMDKKFFCKKSYRIAFILLVASVVIGCIVSRLYYVVSEPLSSNADYEACFDMLLCITACCLFFVAKGSVTMRSDSRVGWLTAQLGGAAFGLYLIENFCRALASPVYKLLYPYVGGFLSSMAMVLVGMTIGFFVVCLLKNIPGLKKIVNKFI